MKSHIDMDSSSSDRPSGTAKRQKSVWRKLVLLLWKNLLLRRRHWLLTSFEILLPTLLFTLILAIRLMPDSAFLPKYISEVSTFDVANEEKLKEILCKKYGMWVNTAFIRSYCFAASMPAYPGERKIFYGPPSNFTKDVALHVADVLRLDESVLQPVASNEDMDVLVEKSYFETNDSWAAFYVGLFFHDLDQLTDDPPEKLNYDLRLEGQWATSQLYPFMQIPGPRNYSSKKESYNMGGFTLIQSLVDRRYVSLLTNSSMHDYQIQTQMYPYPPYTQDHGMSQIYGSMLPTFVVLSLVLLSPSLIKCVVHEKETGVRELVRLMGLDGWLVWLGWFLHAFVIIVLVSSIMTLLLKLELKPTDGGTGLLPPIIEHTDTFFVWILLLLYGVSSIAFCFVIATFFSKPTLATTVGILVWLISFFIPRSLMDFKYDSLGLAPKVLSCLLPNMAMNWAFRIIAMFEGRAKGVQWSTIWETGNPRDQLAPAMILLMLVLDTVLYLLVTWYVDQVNPGVYGVPQCWYFPFQKTYWCGASGPARHDEQPEDQEAPDVGYDECFESEPAGLQPGIVVKNLRKEFKTLGGQVKVAVENVNMTCYEGQCTVLLGHNGAGKTTTMSVLTGVYAPTSGYAAVSGWDISTNLKEARQEVGLCPQHNMLFVDLTVLQHLLFFGRLKGMTTKAAREEACVLMERLDLTVKRNMFGSQLSGGMKRKLCLAIALIGGSKVVILDEPSSGLDPESRRWVWDMVQGERGRRTVLVTTHHMEEADVLGDRVAIMASGRVVCAGSTLFLKNKFGDGYTLTVMMDEDEANVNTLKELVNTHLPSALLRSAQSGEVTFKLPPTLAQFAVLLDALTKRKNELGIRHLGLSLTSMEQVFLRVGEALDDQSEPIHHTFPMSDSVDNNLNGTLNGHVSQNLENENECGNHHVLFDSQTDCETRLTGWSLMEQRAKAFFTKRAIYSMRKWVLLVTQGLLPVLVTILCLLVDASFDETTHMQPARVLNISMFPYSTSYVFADPGKEDLAEAYESLFWGPYEVSRTENVTESLLTEAEENLLLYRENSVCSAEFLRGEGNSTTFRMMYQSIPLHSPGVSTSLIGNALLRFATNSTRHSITTSNRPLPPNRSWVIGGGNTSVSSLLYAMVMPLALALLSASYLVFPLQERETKAKQVQVMTGAPIWMLWATTFLWDVMAYMVSALIVFIIIMIFDSKHYFTVGEAPGVLFLLLMLYGWGSIPMAYVFSFPFHSAASGFAVLALVNIVAGQIMSTAVWALDLSQQHSLMVASNVLNWISSFIPTYPASMGFMHLVNTSSYNDQCNVFNKTVMEDLCESLVHYLPESPIVQCCPQCADVGTETCFQGRSYFLFDNIGMGQDLLSLFVNGVFFFTILILIESITWGKGTNCVSDKEESNEDVVQDDDVAAEATLVDDLLRKRMEDENFEDDATLLVSGLSKQFYGAAHPAVDKISFRVRRGECLGLLGVNGAGKTTTFRMLTGDEYPSSGDALIDKISVQNTTSKFVQQIGYCPQFDAALGELTGVEMLTLVGRLRGVSDRSLKHKVSYLVTLVGLTECAERPSSTYSGGNRRKLSTAMALVGSPPLVFLDEPTSGVDPVSRRRVWTAISQAISNGQSVVLTSHSMEECEALCSRIIIMSRGNLRCIGTTGHLKAKFGQGYNLQVKLRTFSLRQQTSIENEEVYNAKVTKLENTIRTCLPGAALTDQHKGMMAFRVPSRVSWGRLFFVMETLKAGRNPAVVDAVEKGVADPPPSSLVEDYAASDTSLEQVFLSFAREASTTPDDSVPSNDVTTF
ncbi:phospholipid-transporting ATPase ABCA3-like [Panulirus ornatus]|uniref:phospholipid-transporting ATPase ABCA3-like n=1 Tax=Panulirus ornatus TaxID=150431 RepID=UPI003A883D18